LTSAALNYSLAARMTLNPFSLRIALTGLLVFVVSHFASATNLILNGSFELGLNDWSYAGGIGFNVNKPSAEGTNHVDTVTSLAQEITTQPGATYFVRFAAKQTNAPSVFFGGSPVALSLMGTPTPSIVQWHYFTGVAPASSALARLEFQNAGAIDDVQVVATHEPLRILAQPESRSVLQSGAASFAVTVDGGPPISYMWRFKGLPVDGATNSTLLLNNAKSSDAGQYSVLASNVAGTLLSTSATLTVDALPTSPIIVFQPMSDTVPAGYGCTLIVSAIGNEPLTYQWFLNGTAISNATNRALAFPAIAATDAGLYTVRVENQMGEVTSLPATIAITNVAGGGYVDFRNTTTGSRAPIYDYDGVTKLSGAGYAAQLYAGASPGILRPNGTPKPFATGILAGFFSGGVVAIPDVPVGQVVYVQTRVWETSAGVSFEDARARGGKWGVSPIFSIPSTTPPPTVPTPVPMVSFNLRAGSPLFTTGILSVKQRENGKPVEWQLIGAAGSRYLIEKRTPPQTWMPLCVVTNTTGTALFADTNANGSGSFYRSRMLD
jgi:hypothetical protein